MVDAQLAGGDDQAVVAVDGEVAERVGARPSPRGRATSAQAAARTAAPEARTRRG